MFSIWRTGEYSSVQYIQYSITNSHVVEKKNTERPRMATNFEIISV